MGTRGTIRDRGPLRRRKGKGKNNEDGGLPFLATQEEENLPVPPTPPEVALPGLFKGKGKNLLSLPILTVTLGKPTTSTVTATAVLTVEAPAPPATPVIPPPITTTLSITIFPPLSSSDFSLLSSSGSIGLTTVRSKTTVTSDAQNPEETSIAPTEPSEGQSGLTSSQTAGIIVGSIFGVILILAAVFAIVIYRRRRPKRESLIYPSNTRYRTHKRNRSIDAEESLSDHSAGIHVGQTISVITSPRATEHKPSFRIPTLHTPSWLNRLHQSGTNTAPSPPPRTFENNPLPPPYIPSPQPQPQPQPPGRSLASLFSWRSLSPPSAPALQQGRAATSTPSSVRTHQRQSSNSEASQWTGAATQRTDSGIFVPPTALTHPRLGPRALRNETGVPSVPSVPPKDVRRTVRFSGVQLVGRQSGRASLVSVESFGSRGEDEDGLLGEKERERRAGVESGRDV